MISRTDNNGFFAAHWDWLVAGLGVLAAVAAGVLLVLSAGVDPEEAAGESVRGLCAVTRSGAGVKAVDMTEYTRVLQQTVKPPTVPEIAENDASFLVSGSRMFCDGCHKPIPAGGKTCPLCGAEQVADEKPQLDTDGDGIPDDLEKELGLDPNDASDADGDLDGDGFTNTEELTAKTDLKDKNSHPDYLDDLSVTLPLKETVLPFFLRTYTKTPSGMRLEFFDPKKRNDYGKPGYRYSVLIGEAIGNTGFIAKSFEQKTKMVKIKGSNVERPVDVSFAVLERKSDGKTIQLALDEKRKPVDIQAVLAFNRGEPKEFTVVPGSKIALFDTEYKVTEIKSVGKGAKVTIEHLASGKIRTLETLEQ